MIHFIILPLVFILNIILAMASARSEARAHSIESTYLKIKDCCEHKGIKPPFLINIPKGNKHFDYTVIRGCFWTVAFVSVYITANNRIPFLEASFSALSSLCIFRASHGFFYYPIHNKIIPGSYPDGWQTDGVRKTSAIDALFKDTFLDRIILFAAGLFIFMLQVIL